jgi:membrane-associated phospholipid phosphatase
VNVTKTAAALLILCLLTGPALLGQAAASPQAQNTAPRVPGDEKKLPRYVSGFFKDEAEMWTAPFHLDWKGLAIFSTALVATGVLIANDEKIYENFKTYQSRNPWVDKISPKITILGDWGVDCGIAGLFFLGGVLLKDRKARDTGLMAWETLLHTGFVAQVAKHLASRQRPSVENGIDYWYGPAAFFKRYEGEGSFSRYDSFLSGHTITVWGLATVIAENYGSHLWVPITCYGLATLVGLSRLTEDTHWFSDVFVGAAIGFAVGKMVVRNHNKRLQLSPTLSPGGAGLALSYEIR